MEAPKESVEQKQLMLEAQLRAVPGIFNVTTKPIGKKRKVNDFGVSYKRRDADGGGWTSRRKACSAMLPTVADVLSAVLAELKKDGLIPAEVEHTEVEHTPEHTEAELEWLADWCEQHPEPHTITHAMAEAALREHIGYARHRSVWHIYVNKMESNDNASPEVVCICVNKLLLGNNWGMIGSKCYSKEWYISEASRLENE